jgi:hypothetical protein
MECAQPEPSHADIVDGWIKRTVEHGSSIEIVGWFGAALEALWTRAVTTLGTVTLTAIAERVLATTTGRFPFLSIINPHPNGDPRWRQQLAERLATVPRSELLEGLRFALIELLVVIGRLTAEILSEELHAAIAEVTALPDDRPAASVHALPAIRAQNVLS